MTEYTIQDQGRDTVSRARRERTLGTALTELALTISLIVSIVVILALTGVTSALAATRSDLIMMDEPVGSSLTTIAIVTVIGLVMGVLTILALRDVAPAHSKRGHRRPVRR
jgi:hypothetical protein